jgi:hypothetical protein
MPRTKSTAAVSARQSATKKPVAKTIRPRKKTKSVLVDVIEDEPLAGDSAWLEPEDENLKKEADLKKEKNIKKIEAAANSGSPINARASNEDIDSQKKFYRGLAQELKVKGEPEVSESKTRPERSVGLYRRLVIKFVCLVLILAGIVAYFSFSELTVSLNLKGENINDSLLLKVVSPSASSTIATASSTLLASDQTDPRELVSGTIQDLKVKAVKTYPATGETYLGEDISGQVNIINNYNKSQALVATTRILSPDNKLFRIKDAVNVPAGGQVAVAIYTDKPTADMAISPATFTIPGLWAGLQDKIYAQSDTAFTYQQKVKKYVNSSDLDQAAQDINNTLMADAKSQLDTSIATSGNWLYTNNNPATITMDAKINDKVDQFTAQAAGEIVAVSFNKDQAAKLAQAKLNLLVPDDKELTDFNPANIIYSLDNYDPISQTATIKATFTGTMILKGNSEVINPEQLVNLTADQIGVYLKSQSEIQSFNLKFSPYFMNRAPSLVDRIKIIINKN